MSRLVRFVVPLVVLGLAPGLVACGGSESSADDFRAEADQICVDQAKDYTEVERRLGIPEGLEEEVILAERLEENRGRTLSELEELEAPDELAEQWDRYLRIRRQQSDLRKEQLELLREGDEKALPQINEKIVDLNGELGEAGEAAGLTACASIIPKDQAEEAEAVVEEAALTSDPQRACDELVTEDHLEYEFGGSFEVCAEFRKKRVEAFPDEIEVESIFGVGGVQASVRITEVGGEYDGEETVWTLYREDGGWKLNLVQPAS